MSKFFSSFIILLAFSSFAVSQQTQQCGASRDVRIVKDKPSVYLKFERFGKAQNPGEQRLAEESKTSQSRDKGNDIFLRLYNNTCWSLSIATYSFYFTKAPSADDPKKTNFLWGQIQDGTEANVLYRVEERDGKNVLFGGDSYSISTVMPGRSVVFSVLREHLSKGRLIYVKFNYEWEKDKYSNNLAPVHRSEYYSYRLDDEELK